MSEPLIMPVRPGAITPGAKRKLEKAGVIVVECDNPQDIRIVRPWAELNGSDLLIAAMRAIGSESISHGVRDALFKQLLQALEAKANTQ